MLLALAILGGGMMAVLGGGEAGMVDSHNYLVSDKFVEIGNLNQTE